MSLCFVVFCFDILPGHNVSLIHFMTSSPYHLTPCYACKPFCKHFVEELLVTPVTKNRAVFSVAGQW